MKSDLGERQKNCFIDLWILDRGSPKSEPGFLFFPAFKSADSQPGLLSGDNRSGFQFTFVD